MQRFMVKNGITQVSKQKKLLVKIEVKIVF